MSDETSPRTLEIHLFRHGPSSCRERGWMNAREFHAGSVRYAAAGILPASEAPLAPTHVPPARRVYASDLRRSIESAQRLYPGAEIVIDPRFREAYSPELPLRRVRLPNDVWDVLTRVVWVAGWSPGGEPAKVTRRRADEAARYLASEAERWGEITLVGHGFLNLWIARSLLALGWQGPWRSGSRNWNCTTYTRRV